MASNGRPQASAVSGRGDVEGTAAVLTYWSCRPA